MNFKDLLAYQKAFQLAMEIFEITKEFPAEEKYALTDQIRRSSRSVCANMAEGYRRRKYVNHYISKLTDSDAENSETLVWLDFTLACNYITPETHNALLLKSTEIGKLIHYMITHPEKFGCNL
jgi:four helix bundle protein